MGADLAGSGGLSWARRVYHRQQTNYKPFRNYAEQAEVETIWLKARSGLSRWILRFNLKGVFWTGRAKHPVVGRPNRERDQALVERRIFSIAFPLASSSISLSM